MNATYSLAGVSDFGAPDGGAAVSSSMLAEAPGSPGLSHESRLSAVTLTLRALTKSETASAF